MFHNLILLSYVQFFLDTIQIKVKNNKQTDEHLSHFKFFFVQSIVIQAWMQIKKWTSKISRFPDFIQYFPDFSQPSPDFSLTKFFKVRDCERCGSLNPRLWYYWDQIQKVFFNNNNSALEPNALKAFVKKRYYLLLIFFRNWWN